jgi:hypothetical protein
MDRSVRSPVRNIQPPHLEEWIGVAAEARGKALQDLLELADALPQGLRPDCSPRLPEKVLAVHHALAESGVPHAHGGAVAFAYYGEPRTTIDIDVNIFLPADRCADVRNALDSLPIEVDVDERLLRNETEARLPWDRNDLHLFFSEDALHEAMPDLVREVPFAGETIPLVSPEHLVVRKAMLDRPKDWLDIEAILIATAPLDLDEIVTWVQRLVGDGDPRVTKLHEALGRLPS